MTKFTISTECGLATVEADAIDAAKEIYERTHHYDFDGARDGEYPGSWYWIADDTGERVEECLADAP